MSVKISTKKELDANFYNRMFIREVDDGFCVKVNSEKLTDDYVSISYRISDNFKKMKDNDKIISIVESFLESTEINGIELSCMYAGQVGEFIKISGTRELYLQISNPELLKLIIKMIKSKYDRDRYKYCNLKDLNNFYNIVLNGKESSYSEGFLPCEQCVGYDCKEFCPKHTEFRLMYTDGKMLSFEEKFIQRFIYDKLWEIGRDAFISEDTGDIKVGGDTKIGTYVKSYIITCGDLFIRFNVSAFSRSYVFDLCNEIVNKYNEELVMMDNNEVMKRQLKMEGF